MLHERVVLLTVSTAPVPHVADDERFTSDAIGHGIYSIRLVYGFMEDPHVPDALRSACAAGVDIDVSDITYFLGRETILVTGRRGMARWREQLFVFMTRNAVTATSFFRLPAERVVELGVQVEI
jgi:KUP system potassium uptake protein